MVDVKPLTRVQVIQKKTLGCNLTTYTWYSVQRCNMRNLADLVAEAYESRITHKESSSIGQLNNKMVFQQRCIRRQSSFSY